MYGTFPSGVQKVSLHTKEIPYNCFTFFFVIAFTLENDDLSTQEVMNMHGIS